MDLNETPIKKIEEFSTFTRKQSGFTAKEDSCYEQRSEREGLHRKLKREGNSQQCETGKGLIRR